MSQTTWLSQFDPSSFTNESTAMQIASELIERRRKMHGSATMTAGTGEGAGTGGQTGGEGGSSTGGAGGEGTPSGDAGAAKDAGGDPQKKISALEEEKDRHFKARQEAEDQLKKYQDAEAERERASNDELTNTKNDLKAAQETIATLQSSLDQAILDNALLTDNTHQWQNPARVLKLVDRDSLEIKEDGTVSGLKEALEALAKSDPYLLKTADSGEGSGSGGGQTGEQHNGKKNQQTGKSREELARKYPALRR